MNCKYGYRCKMHIPECSEVYEMCRLYKSFKAKEQEKIESEKKATEDIHQGDIGLTRVLTKDNLWVDRRWSGV